MIYGPLKWGIFSPRLNKIEPANNKSKRNVRAVTRIRRESKKKKKAEIYEKPRKFSYGGPLSQLSEVTIFFSL